MTWERHGGEPMSEYWRALQAAEDEEGEIADTDTLVRSEIAALIANLARYQRTLPNIRYLGRSVERYAPLIDELRELAHDHAGGDVPADDALAVPPSAAIRNRSLEGEKP